MSKALRESFDQAVTIQARGEGTMIPEFLRIYRRARLAGELRLAALALEAVAFEYDRAGASTEAKLNRDRANALLAQKKGLSAVPLPENLVPDNATELEAKLIMLIAEKTKTRLELVGEVYDVGAFSDSEALENRLKNLLARVRKKYPGLIVREGDRYRLSRYKA